MRILSLTIEIMLESNPEKIQNLSTESARLTSSGAQAEAEHTRSSIPRAARKPRPSLDRHTRSIRRPRNLGKPLPRQACKLLCADTRPTHQATRRASTARSRAPWRDCASLMTAVASDSGQRYSNVLIRVRIMFAVSSYSVIMLI